jgi:hypothetical protein
LVLRVTSLQKKIIAEGRRILGTTLEVDLPKVVIQEFRSVVSAVRVLLDLRQVNRKWKVGSNKHRFAPTGLFFVCLGGFHTNPFRGNMGTRDSPIAESFRPSRSSARKAATKMTILTGSMLGCC